MCRLPGWAGAQHDNLEDPNLAECLWWQPHLWNSRLCKRRIACKRPTQFKYPEELDVPSQICHTTPIGLPIWSSLTRSSIENTFSLQDSYDHFTRHVLFWDLFVRLFHTFEGVIICQRPCPCQSLILFINAVDSGLNKTEYIPVFQKVLQRWQTS